jgi:hypothetical protein
VMLLIGLLIGILFVFLPAPWRRRERRTTTDAR